MVFLDIKNNFNREEIVKSLISINTFSCLKVREEVYAF